MIKARGLRKRIKKEIINYINNFVHICIKDNKEMGYRDYRCEVSDRSLGFIDFAFKFNLITKKDRDYFIDKLMDFVWYN